MLKYTDHQGNKFSTKAKMCKYWATTKSAYDNRVSRGWSQKDALENPIYSLILDNDLTSMTLLETIFYKVIYRGELDIWTYDEIMAYYRYRDNLKYSLAV